MIYRISVRHEPAGSSTTRMLWFVLRHLLSPPLPAGIGAALFVNRQILFYCERSRMPQDRSERVDPYPAIAIKRKRTSTGLLPATRSSPFAFLAGLIALCREGQAENGREADYEIADD
jgi:hypothetical protein